jgi:hypothetical protein
MLKHFVEYAGAMVDEEKAADDQEKTMAQSENMRSLLQTIVITNLGLHRVAGQAAVRRHREFDFKCP